jgi:DNA-directed RNA polymerase subunit RPC12/RpoP
VEITLKCPSCGAALPVSAARAPARVRCGRCGREMPLAVSPALRDDAAVDACPLCEGRDFYLRKDFDPKVGLSVVVAGAIVSGIFYWFDQDLIAYGILAAAVLIDVIVYRRLGDVTVCYRCHAEFRGSYPRTAPPFDLHTADVLEPEWERKIGRR